jgi:hypothetical protein
MSKFKVGDYIKHNGGEAPNFACIQKQGHRVKSFAQDGDWFYCDVGRFHNSKNWELDEREFYIITNDNTRWRKLIARNEQEAVQKRIELSNPDFITIVRVIDASLVSVYKMSKPKLEKIQ